MGVIYVTPYYKYLEAKYIVKHSPNYSFLAIEKAKELIKNYEDKNTINYTRVTEDQRNELKSKYPNLYKN